MIQKRILLDMDGVITDFVRASLLYHKKEILYQNIRHDFDRNILETREAFWEPLGFDFWSTLPWIEEGKKLLSGLIQRLGIENITICTKPARTKGCAEGKIAWIKREIPEFETRYILTHNKYFTAHMDLILIDDNDINCTKFNNARGRSILVPQPWNERRAESYTASGILEELEYLLYERA